MELDEITLTGMEFFGHHGCLAEEQRLGQRFLVDLTMGLPLAKAGRTDDLQATVNYAEVYARVRAIVEGEPARLLETVAERICDCVLRDFALVQMVTVTVHKPGAPIAGILREAALTLHRRRGEGES